MRAAAAAAAAALCLLLLLGNAAAESATPTRKCTLTSTEKCELNKFPVDVPVLIYPGGSSKCLLGAPYAFQVVRGDKNKLLFHFQGGGACFDETSILLDTCQKTPESVPLDGIFNRQDPRNRYRHYTVVSVLYCSGDIHVGNNYQWGFWDIFKLGEQPVYQRGVENFRSVVAYLERQMAFGHVNRRLDELMLTGSSAGALGIQWWFGYLLSRPTWSAKKVAVVADSLAGIFPHDSVVSLLKTYGACSALSLMPPGVARLKPSCDSGNMTFSDVVTENLKKHPSVPVLFIQSEFDVVQLAFYDGINVIDGMPSPELDDSAFFQKTLEFLQTYNSQRNFMTYWINADTHQYLTQPWYFEASNLGSSAGQAAIGAPMLWRLVNLLPLSVGSNFSSFGTAGAPYVPKVFVQRNT